MSVTIRFKGKYDERERDIEETVKWVKKNFSDAEVYCFNPKGIVQHVVYRAAMGAIEGLQEGVKEYGGDIIQKLIGFDQIENVKNVKERHQN